MNFDSLDVPIPENIIKKSPELQKDVYEYLSTMNVMQKEAYIIACDHLGSSFNILKSNGYIEWKLTQK